MRVLSDVARELGGALLTVLSTIPSSKRPTALQAAQASLDLQRSLRCDTPPLSRDGIRFGLVETMPHYRRHYTTLRQPALLLSAGDPIEVLLVTADPGMAFQLAAIGETRLDEPLPAGLLVYVMGEKDEAGERFYADVSLLLPSPDATDPGQPLRLVRRVEDADHRTYWAPSRPREGREVSVHGYLRMEASPDVLARVERIEPRPDSGPRPPLSLQQPIAPFLLRLEIPSMKPAGKTRLRLKVLVECFRRGLTRLEELRQLITAEGLDVKHVGPEVEAAFLAALRTHGLQVRAGEWLDPPPEPTTGEPGPDLQSLNVAQLIKELKARPERMPPPKLVESLTFSWFSRRKMEDCLRNLAIWGQEMPLRDLADPEARVRARAWEYHAFKTMEKDLGFLQILLWWNGIWLPWRGQPL